MKVLPREFSDPTLDWEGVVVFEFGWELGWEFDSLSNLVSEEMVIFPFCLESS